MLGRPGAEITMSHNESPTRLIKALGVSAALRIPPPKIFLTTFLVAAKNLPDTFSGRSSPAGFPATQFIQRTRIVNWMTARY